MEEMEPSHPTRFPLPSGKKWNPLRRGGRNEKLLGAQKDGSVGEGGSMKQPGASLTV